MQNHVHGVQQHAAIVFSTLGLQVKLSAPCGLSTKHRICSVFTDLGDWGAIRGLTSSRGAVCEATDFRMCNAMLCRVLLHSFVFCCVLSSFVLFYWFGCVSHDMCFIDDRTHEYHWA